MKNLEINIPDMQSTHCQARVKGAVKDIIGANVQKIEAGKLSFSFESELEKEEFVEAIQKAGYKVEGS